jgi:uncharacterized membrane protein YvbJ
MGAKFCPQCGASIPENSKFCLSCGADLSAVTSQPTVNTVESQPKNVVSSNAIDFEIAAARNKSYTGTAVLIFFLYLLFFFPGLIVNYIYVQEAKKMEEKAGMKLPGVNLLNIMLQISSWTVVISFCIAIYLIYYLFK